MEETIQTLINQLQQLINVKKNYLKNKNRETFRDDQTRNEEQLIVQGENVLDRKSNLKERIEKILKIYKEMETTIHSIEREMNQMKKWIGEEDKNVVESMKETIETIKQIRQRKTNKEILKNPKRKRTIQAECDDENEEIDERDGLYVSTADYWVHLRRSNTEPIVRVIAEAETLEKAKEAAEKVMSILLSA